MGLSELEERQPYAGQDDDERDEDQRKDHDARCPAAAGTTAIWQYCRSPCLRWRLVATVQRRLPCSRHIVVFRLRVLCIRLVLRARA